MSLSADFLWVAIHIALGVLSLAFLMVTWRVLRGPTLPDRVVGLDALVVIAIGFIATIGIKTGFTLYVDIALALGLVGFLATVAFARFTLSLQGKIQQQNDEQDEREENEGKGA
ncbi:cation:proton antiporter [Tianweitania sp. BSSL-BM11]|uniref:Cation:proton antiporter n=1 Tax=Tianweitania aestuarii TaxID=2814886 RepID=A0ABS5RVY8_9HYPH|nr:cation:proton antiporter [Tianweitania aestuarii]MBS9719862.1 cation:proton antiporter [Tianweitania aestuarii]